MAFKRILVTAALPYANDDIHLGHLAGAYLPSDIYVRYQRLKKRDVLFVCGSDEHGVAITVSAEKEGVTPRTIVDRYHPANRAAFEKFGMSFDIFSRTTLPLHHATAQTFFRRFHEAKVLKEKDENQLYCEKDRMFLADRYVEGTCPNCKYPQARGDQCENCGTWLNQTDLIEPRCKICGTVPVVRTTSHWYFPLGNYQKRLEAYIRERNERDGWKENVLRYCESWFKEGLQDRAVTRDIRWGVPVPISGYEGKVIYVWFDAVLGYISATKEWAEKKGTPDRWKEYWQSEDTKYVAFIGKDNVVFHCIVFPAMLMAWNDAGDGTYILPENVPANEFLNFEGQKFSKSRGWGIDVQDFLKFFPADDLRYALAVNLPETRDSDFILKDFQARTNNELADNLGNFINRTMAFAEKHFDGRVPACGPLGAMDREMTARLHDAPVRVGENFEHYRMREGVQEAMNVARAANKYFNDSEPWKTVKSDRSRCETTIHVCLQVVRTLCVLLEPVVPATARSTWRMLGLGEPIEKAEWDRAAEFQLKAGGKLGTAGILIRKIEDGEIDALKQFIQRPPESKPETAAAPVSEVSIEDFRRIELKTATIVRAEKVPKSQKLLRLDVQIGTEERQIVAGIALQYKPEELVGRSVVIVTNLKSARLMGLESHGMLLAANSADGTLSIITPSENVPSGSIVK